MSVLKRYNQNTQQWEPINKAPAVGVFTDNAVLTTNQDPVRSVEDILVQNRQELDLLRKNVSWLALHGGGGGFGSGGVSGNNATVQIFDPADGATDVSEFIWSKTYEDKVLTYKIASNTSTSTYTVQIRVNGVIKATSYGVKRNQNQTVSMKTLGLGSKEDTISIIAVDKDENEFSKTCKVIIASVELQNPEAVTFTQNVLLTGTPKLSLRYKVSVAGDYKLYYSDSIIYFDQEKGWCDGDGAPLEDSNNNRSQYIDILKSGTSYNNISVNLTNIYNSTNPNDVKELISKNSSPGSYMRYFVLVKADNNSIYSPIAAAQINVVLTNGILVTPSMGVNENDRYSVTADSILNLRFITWKGGNSSGTYSYKIFVGDTELTDLARSGQIFGQVVTVPINISTYDVFSKTGQYNIRIVSRQIPYESEGICYINITEKSTDVVRSYFKNIKKYAIFDYTFWDATWNKNAKVPSNRLQYENDEFNYGDITIKDIHKSYIDFYNIGEDSGLGGEAGGGVYYKLTHTAAGQITCDKSIRSKLFPIDNNDTDALVRGDDYNFSLQVAYSIDIESSDDAVVFRMGDYDINTGLGQGVVITAHNYYVKIDNTTMLGALQDNSFTQFDLVCYKNEVQGVRWIYIYQNGVLLQAAEHKIPTIGYSLFGIDKIFIGCDNIIMPTDENGDIIESGINVINPINTNAYSVRLFNTGLSVGEIVCSYVNNYVNYKRTNDGLDPELVSTMLQNNLINADKYVNDPIDPQPISRLFNFRTENDIRGDYNWNLSVTGNKVNLGNLADLPDRSGIPIVVLNMQGWTYDQFTKTGADFVNEPKQGTFTYIYPGNNDGITSNSVTVELQGTSTLGYTIKNLNVTFNNEMFSPKDTWFPEETFTLKADVVDSAHINNAAIGTFVNDCINEASGTLINTGAFPTREIIERCKNLKLLPPNLTFKATIEGFPVVLVVNFSNGDVPDPRVLGIYSFNLGRESYHNQGLEVLTSLRNTNGDVLDASSAVFPGLFGKPTAQDLDNTYSAYCFEGTKSINSTYNQYRQPSLDDNTYDFAVVTVDGKEMWYPAVYNINGYVGYDATHYITNAKGDLIQWNNTNVRKMMMDTNGYFWSNDVSFAKGLFECKYAKNQTDAWNQFCNEGSVFASPHEYLTGCISTYLPYRKGNIVKTADSNIPVWKMIGSAGDVAETVYTGESFKIFRPQQPHGLPISVQNTAFYFVVCQLFGLIDNFGKNLQFKYWGIPTEKNNVSYKWSPTFYDMDTALGVSNTGTEDVPPTVFDESIINLPNAGNAKFMFGQAPNSLTGFPKTGANPTFTVYSNKLWGSLEDSDIYAWYQTDYGSTESSGFRVYSRMWNALRSKMVNSVDDLIDKYFTTSLSKCGEFLYNYDYYTKYLNTPQYSMLHGNRKSFIYNWLSERIAFLDSVFGYRYSIDENYNSIVPGEYLTSSTSLMPYNISWKNSVNFNHGSGSLTMPIKSNKSLIYCVQIGGGAASENNSPTKSYRFISKNQEDYIKVADSINTQGIQTLINNSDCIIDLPNLHSIKLNGVDASQGAAVKDKTGREIYGENMVAGIKYQQGSLSGLKKFDISGIGTINKTINLFNLFKTWDTSGFGKTPAGFALQELNYANTSSVNLLADLTGISSTDANIPTIYTKPFVNLISIDISNSLVSSIDIPQGVTLQKLNVENSSVPQLILNGQPLLTELNLSKCQQLKQVKLIKCDKLETVSFDGSNVNITEISIAECKNLKTLIITPGGRWYNIPAIDIQDCPNLKTVIISGCTKENYIPNKNDSKTYIRIVGVPKLEQLTINNSLYNAIVWDGAENLTNLKKLDISSSTIYRIGKDWPMDTNNIYDSTKDYIDLRGFKSDTFMDADGNVQINFKKNNNITHVYFDNVRIVEGGGKYKIHVPDPFVLNLEECFGDCANLERVYGYIHVAGPRIFNKCKKFYINKFNENANGSVRNQIIRTDNTSGLQQTQNTLGNHGDEIDILNPYDTTWDSIIIRKSGGRFTHPTDITSSIGDKKYYNLLRKYDGKFRCAWLCHSPLIRSNNVHDYFEFNDGLYVNTGSTESPTWEIYNSTEHADLQRYSCLDEGKCTNLMISGKNVSGAFTETDCNDWDVYYTLFNCDSDNEDDSINISSLFSGCENLTFGWYGDPKSGENNENNSNDNSPSRFTFMNCHRASSASGVFSVKTLSKIKSPYISDDNDIHGYGKNVIVDGLYTPLKNNCKVIGRVVSGQVIMDKNVLRTYTLNNDHFVATSISNLTCKNFVDDVNNITRAEYDNSGKIDNSGVAYENHITGDVSKLLIDCPNITSINKLLNEISYINYDTVCGDSIDKKICLSKVTSISNSFISDTATGNIVLKDMYTDPENCKHLTNIYSSFVNNSATEGGELLTLEFTNDLFDKFEGLEYISFDPEENDGLDSFSGGGLRKCIPNEGFPYQMFNNCKNLKVLVGLFQNLDCTNISSNAQEDGIGLPGDLFKNCPQLEEIPRLFYNMTTNVPAYLTSNSFENCSKLKNVAYAFACDATGKLNAFRTSGYIDSISGKNIVKSIQPYIPEKLFYHGEIKSQLQIVGSNYTEEVDGVYYQTSTRVWSKNINGVTRTYSGELDVLKENTSDDINSPNGRIRINPATVITENGQRIYLVSNNSNSGDVNLIIISEPINIPLTNITNMEGCFQGGDWSEYIAPYNRVKDISGNPVGEYNVRFAEDYSPVKYVLNNGVWMVNTKYQPYKNTLMWEYDGDWKMYDKLVNTKLSDISEDLLMLDDAYNCITRNHRVDYSSVISDFSTKNIEMTLNVDGNGHDLILNGNFCYAPDLLRYCSSSVNVKKLFMNCGPTYHTYAKSDSIRYGSNSPVSHYGLKGRLVPYTFKTAATISNISNMFTHCKFIGSYIKEFETTDSNGNPTTIPYAYPIPESFVKYLTNRNLDMTNTFMGWYFPANTNLDVFRKNTSCTYTLLNTFKWPLFSNRLCDNGGVVNEAYVGYPATFVSGIFNDGDGHIRAGNVGGIFNLSQQDSDNESNTNLVRNQSVKFNDVFAMGGYTIGTDTYCFAGYTDPSKEHGMYPGVEGATRFGNKTVRYGGENDKLYRNYVVYKDKPLY
jgi:hypothetical protein